MNYKVFLEVKDESVKRIIEYATMCGFKGVTAELVEKYIALNVYDYAMHLLFFAFDAKIICTAHLNDACKWVYETQVLDD